MTGRTLRVWHVGAKASPRTVNGDNQAAWALARVQAEHGHEVTMVIVDEPLVESDAARSDPVIVPGQATSIRAITFQEALRSMSAERVDVLHLHSVNAPAHALLALRARTKSIPYVITPHGGYAPQILARHNRRKRLYRSTVERWKVRNAAAVVAVVPGEIQDIKRLAASEAVNCEVIPNIIDAIRPRTDAPERSAVFERDVVYLGRLEVIPKGIDRVLEIARALPHRRFDLYGPSHPSMDGIDLPPNVALHDPVYGVEKERVLDSARVLVQLSRWEVFGISVIEALLLGAQVMVADVMLLSPWVREAGGLVVPSADGKHAARTLEEFLAAPHDQRAANARAAAAGRLIDPATNQEKHLRLYTRVLSGSHRPRSERRSATRPIRWPLARAAWRGADLMLRAATIITDLVPARYRFGIWMRLIDLLAFGQTLPRIPHPGPPPVTATTALPAPANAGLRCLIVAGHLDNGGIETVVATLAAGLSRQGFDVEVVCASGGRTATRLLQTGVRVSVVRPAMVAEVVESFEPDVIQLHRVDPDIVDVLVPFADRTVPVFHAMESYLDDASWQALDRLMSESVRAIAVSESVREFFASRYPSNAIDVVVNGVAALGATSSSDRAGARATVSRTVGVPFGDSDTLVVSLQRFSDQKNPRGLVDAFLLASEQNDRLRLVIAGATNSWLEVRRADAARRAHPNGDRVHFLDDSDAEVLLKAADLFALDSLAEGGPVAAVEAAACGLPVVLSDVGFARELVAASAAKGVVVPRANADMSARSIARARRMRKQVNRDAFAAGILTAAQLRRTEGGVPEQFREETMISAHANVLRSVGSASPRI